MTNLEKLGVQKKVMQAGEEWVEKFHHVISTLNNSSC